MATRQPIINLFDRNTVDNFMSDVFKSGQDKLQDWFIG